MFENTHLQQNKYTASEFYTTLPKSLPVSDASLLKGEPLYSRKNLLIGHSFNLDADCSECINNLLINNDDIQIIKIKIDRLLNIYLNNNLSIINSEKKYFLIAKVSLRLLFEKNLFSLLNNACMKLKDKNLQVFISLDASNFIMNKYSRKIWECIYTLHDKNIEFILSNPSDKTDKFIVSNNIFSTISVTPEWLGVNSNEDLFDLSKYISSVSILSNFIHENGKNIIFEGISTAWHQSFLSCLPVTAYTLTCIPQPAPYVSAQLSP